MFILYISRKSVLYVLLLSLFFLLLLYFLRCLLRHSGVSWTIQRWGELTPPSEFMVPDFRHMDHLLNWCWAFKDIVLLLPLPTHICRVNSMSYHIIVAYFNYHQHDTCFYFLLNWVTLSYQISNHITFSNAFLVIDCMSLVCELLSNCGRKKKQFCWWNSSVSMSLAKA